MNEIMLCVTSYVLHVFQITIMVPAYVIYCKRNEDVLQGLSRLDYLLKVSMF